MSGAAEGIAGLALSAVSVAALFTTCIECFDIVIRAREFRYDYQILCADLDLQRLRFCLWGESVGLASRDAAVRPIPNHGLDHPTIHGPVARALQAIQLLLQKTDDAREQFEEGTSRLRGLRVLRGPFERVRRAQRETNFPSLGTATRWAVHSRETFKEKIDRLKSLIDGLESVTESLGFLEVQRSRMREEIDSIDDIEDLRLIEEASIRSQPDISDTASRRILLLENDSIAPSRQTTTSSVVQTFHTAEENAAAEVSNAVTGEEIDETPTETIDEIPQHQRILAQLSLSAARTPQWRSSQKTEDHGSVLETIDVVQMAETAVFPLGFEYLAGAMARNAEDNHEEDASALVAVKRVRMELSQFAGPDRDINWIAAAPIRGNISHVLSAFEGPPDTPYERGIFFLESRYSPDHPFKPCTMRFLTRVYHPNIDSRGNICVDLLTAGWWPGLTVRQLLVSSVSLLSDPNLEVALVPEIAQTYCEDYELYCRNARHFTKRYASVPSARQNSVQFDIA